MARFLHLCSRTFFVVLVLISLAVADESRCEGCLYQATQRCDPICNCKGELIDGKCSCQPGFEGIKCQNRWIDTDWFNIVLSLYQVVVGALFVGIAVWSFSLLVAYSNTEKREILLGTRPGRLSLFQLVALILSSLGVLTQYFIDPSSVRNIILPGAFTTILQALNTSILHIMYAWTLFLCAGILGEKNIPFFYKMRYSVIGSCILVFIVFITPTLIIVFSRDLRDLFSVVALFSTQALSIAYGLAMLAFAVALHRRRDVNRKGFRFYNTVEVFCFTAGTLFTLSFFSFIIEAVMFIVVPRLQGTKELWFVDNIITTLFILYPLLYIVLRSFHADKSVYVGNLLLCQATKNSSNARHLRELSRSNTHYTNSKKFNDFLERSEMQGP